MARTRRNELSRARRGVSSVRGERRTIRSPVNGPNAESIAWIQHLGTHLGAPSDIMRSSLVHSSGFEVQTGCLADSLDVHQPMCMRLQPSRTDLDVLTLAEFDATQRLERTDIGAVNLQAVFPLEFGNQSSESIRASPFQSDGSLASVLSCKFSAFDHSGQRSCFNFLVYSGEGKRLQQTCSILLNSSIHSS
jgi:hypothetical protein